MRRVLNFFAIMLALSMSVSLAAQDFYVKGGLNLSSMIIKDNDTKYHEDFSSKPGLNLGVTVDIPIVDLIFIETGLMFSAKGYQEKDSEGDVNYKDMFNLYYMDIPIMGKIKHDLGNSKIYGSFGPYIGLAIRGNNKEVEKGEDYKEIFVSKLEIGSDEYESDIKKTDFGLIIGGGIEFNNFQIGLNYNLGLSNISPINYDDFQQKNRVFAITLGYKFAGK